MIDWRGNSIEVGDTVLYPAQVGHSTELVEAIVLDFGERLRDWGSPQPFMLVRPLHRSRKRIWTDQPSRLTTLKNVTRVEPRPEQGEPDGSADPAS